MRTNPGRAWAYVGAGVGAAATVAANTAHSFVPPAGEPVGWRPEPGAVIAAAFWPIALLVSVEILVRVQWPEDRWVTLLRFVGLGLVAAVAAVVSYLHLSGLLLHYSEDWLTVLIGPLAIDGLLLMSSAALLTTTPASGGGVVVADTATSGSATPPQSSATPIPPVPPLRRSEPTTRHSATPPQVAEAGRHKPVSVPPLADMKVADQVAWFARQLAASDRRSVADWSATTGLPETTVRRRLEKAREVAESASGGDEQDAESEREAVAL